MEMVSELFVCGIENGLGRGGVGRGEGRGVLLSLSKYQENTATVRERRGLRVLQ